MDNIDIHQFVSESYANKLKQQKSCCEPNNAHLDSKLKMYSATDLRGLDPELLRTSFGCGNPIQVARLNPGETVLDLGCGAGFDILLASRLVGDDGRAIGLDMTDQMLEAAHKNQADAGIENVEFIKGHIEKVPLPDDTVDVVISNCVINLAPDKRPVLFEAFRVIKPGGRFAISDIVLTKSLPKLLAENLDLWSGCVAGALLVEEYKSILSEAGFEDITVEKLRDATPRKPAIIEIINQLTDQEKKDLEGTIISAAITAYKPLE